MEVLEEIGIAIGFLVILVFGIFVTMVGIIFMFGLPSLFASYLSRIGRYIKQKFPKIAENRKIQGLGVILLVILTSLVLFSAISLWFWMLEALPD